jgi:tellurite resistance protein
MHDQNMAILKSLVSVAWADGEFADKEREMVEALLSAFEADEGQAKEIRAYAAEKKSLDDIPFDELTADDCRVLLQHAVLLTYVDGTQHESEKKLIHDLCARLGFPEAQAKDLISYADARAKRFLNLL